METLWPTRESLQDAFARRPAPFPGKRLVYLLYLDNAAWIFKFTRESRDLAPQNAALAKALGLPVVDHHFIPSLENIRIPDEAASLEPKAAIVMPYINAKSFDVAEHNMFDFRRRKFGWNVLGFMPQLLAGKFIDFAGRNILCPSWSLKPRFIDMEWGFFNEPDAYLAHDREKHLSNACYYLKKGRANYIDNVGTPISREFDRYKAIILESCDLFDEKITDTRSALMQNYSEMKDYLVGTTNALRETVTDPALERLAYRF